MSDALPPLLPRIPLPFAARTPQELATRARAFADALNRRRTVRDFSDRAVPRAVIESALDAARHAPNGANRQPWHFVAVQDGALKRRIRAAAEAEEREFYAQRAPREWLEALAPLGTDSDKPFLETAPWLIVAFAQPYEVTETGKRLKNYYVSESLGIACGFMIACLHHAGLAMLTHTPSPMGFLGEILGRPKHEKAYLILVAGYPAENARVPDLRKKPFAQIASFR